MFIPVLLWSLLLPMRALADHVTEPTAPIEAVDLQLSHYSTGTPVDCVSGTDEVDFGNLRVDAFVTVSAAPSEYWQTRANFENFKRPILSWKMEWNHQNVAPHQPRTVHAWTGSQSGVTDHPGPWTITWEIWGDESGRYRSDSCSFISVDPRRSLGVANDALAPVLIASVVALALVGTILRRNNR